LHPNIAISNKHIFINFKNLLNFTKTKLEPVLQQNVVISIYMKVCVFLLYVITHYGICQFRMEGFFCDFSKAEYAA